MMGNRPQKITLGEMREAGVRHGADLYCSARADIIMRVLGKTGEADALGHQASRRRRR